MRRIIASFLFVALVAAVIAPALAGATTDLRVVRDKDEKRNVVYKLVNTGSKTIRAKVEHRTECSGVTNNRKPKVREYWLSAGKSVQLGKSWSESSCRRDFRIVEAEYR